MKKNNLFTIGVEEEYMICDVESYNLIDKANEILKFIDKSKQKNFSYEIIDPGEHKKFEYYTNYAFAVTANGAQILSGGRYDNLCKELGGKNVYASGFAINMNEIVQLTSNG